MLEISQIKLPCGTDTTQIPSVIRKRLSLREEESFTWKITRHSVDARKKPDLYDIYSVSVEFESPDTEKKLIRGMGLSGSNPSGNGHISKGFSGRHKSQAPDRNIRLETPVVYHFPEAPADAPLMEERPVVIGFGPAGIFCSLMLARAGYRPIVLERGERMEERISSVKHFWESGELNPESNIQFGEGGAGTFSDGKLNSNVKDKSGRVSEVIRTFLAAGAPEDIAYEQIPHIGTDRLRGVIRNIREEILSLGGEIRFGTKAEKLLIRDGSVRGVVISRSDIREDLHGESKRSDKDDFFTSGYGWGNSDSRNQEEVISTSHVVLAPGHSARDTIRELFRENVPMESKPFAVGFRVSHPQALINASQYGIRDAAEMKRLHLSPANYKLTARASDGHGVYSFCMCPGGFVVNASSEPGRLAVNGMSNYLRDSARANSAIVMTVGPEDFGGNDVLDGCRFQEQLEEKAFHLCDGSGEKSGRIPVQSFASFEGKHLDERIPSSEELCIKGASAAGRLDTLLPANLSGDFTEGMHLFGRKIRGFDGPEAWVIGLESRTSSPVRILRDENGESAVKGLYPCGEGAGFAGGITSAAVDGIRIAENIARRFRAPEK